MIFFCIRKLLITLGYPRLESSRSLIGPYRDVGVLQIRIPESIACQVFYPASPRTKRVRTPSPDQEKCFVPYFRPEAVKGLVDYLRFGDGLLQLLQEVPHPCIWQGEPRVSKDDAKGDSSLFPLVLFSHGLAGTYEMYTELCQQLASLGYCVVAFEHEDGSAAYCQTAKGNVIPYTRPDDEPYSRSKVWKLRTPMLEQRVQEMEAVVRYFQEQQQHLEKPKKNNANDDDNGNGSDDKSLLLLHKVIRATDLSQLHLVGHSFGGATQMLAAQQWIGSNNEKRSDYNGILQPKSLMVMDAWAFALPDRVVQQGLSPNRNHPIDIMSVISEDWEQHNTERQYIADFFQNSPAHQHLRIQSFVVSNAVHQSFSDSEAWFPSFVARQVQNRGKGEGRHVTIRAVVQAWSRMIGTKSNVVDDETVGEEKKRQKCLGKANSPILRPWALSCMIMMMNLTCCSAPATSL
jgi:dienelactone hydrolase